MLEPLGYDSKEKQAVAIQATSQALPEVLHSNTLPSHCSKQSPTDCCTSRSPSEVPEAQVQISYTYTV